MTRVAPAAAPRLGAAQRRLDPRGRLRQRVPLREPADRGAAGARPRRPRDLHRHLQQGFVPGAARRLPRDPRRPGGALRRRARGDRHFPPTLYQAVLADFLAEGHFARHLRRMRRLYRERRGALVEALRSELGTAVQVLGEEAGMHLTAILEQGNRTAGFPSGPPSRVSGRCRSPPAISASPPVPGWSSATEGLEFRRSRKGCGGWAVCSLEGEPSPALLPNPARRRVAAGRPRNRRPRPPRTRQGRAGSPPPC